MDAQFGNHTNDLTDVSGMQDDALGLTIVTFRRKLLTGDSWDVALRPGAVTQVVWAINRHGSDNFLVYHGPVRGRALARARHSTTRLARVRLARRQRS